MTNSHHCISNNSQSSVVKDYYFPSGTKRNIPLNHQTISHTGQNLDGNAKVDDRIRETLSSDRNHETKATIDYHMGVLSHDTRTGTVGNACFGDVHPNVAFSSRTYREDSTNTLRGVTTNKTGNNKTKIGYHHSSVIHSCNMTVMNIHNIVSNTLNVVDL